MKIPFWRQFDYISFVAVLFLLSLGLLTIYSISLVDGKIGLESIFTKQCVFVLIGLACYFLFSRIDYRALKNVSYLIYFLSLFFLIITYVWGIETRGSTRWIDIGFFSIEPSEIMKLASIIMLAARFSSMNVNSPKNLISPALLTLIPIVLIFKQPDLGSSIVLIVIGCSLTFLSGINWRFVVIGGLVASLLVPLSWEFLKDYQRERVLTFMNPSSDPLGSGYNVIQSVIAVGSGQLIGKGFGRGTQSHLNFLPEHHTDFIFATLSEELGLLGSSILLIAFLVLLFRLIAQALATKDLFGSLLISGVAIQIAFQLFVNVGMNIGMLPVTGITLPLISYGGSSLIVLLTSLGIAQSVVIHRDSERVFDS